MLALYFARDLCIPLLLYFRNAHVLSTTLKIYSGVLKLSYGHFTFLFCRGRHGIVLKCVSHVQHVFLFSLDQSNLCVCVCVCVYICVCEVLSMSLPFAIVLMNCVPTFFQGPMSFDERKVIEGITLVKQYQGII